MLQIFGWLVLTFVLFVAFVVLVIWGLVKKDWVKFIYGLLVLASCITTLGYTGYKAVSKLGRQKTLAKIHFGRSGEEIYTGLFGKPEVNCVKIAEYKDQIIPKIDAAITLHFNTCPEEITRILAQQKYEEHKTTVNSANIGVSLADYGFDKAAALGDSVFVFQYQKSSRNVQFIITNLQKTEGYCIDILD